MTQTTGFRKLPTPFHRSAEKWIAWLFDCPGTDCGMIQGIRFQESLDESLTIYPKGIHLDEMCSFENPKTGDLKSIDGSLLVRNGFTFTLSKRSGSLWFYRRAI